MQIATHAATAFDPTGADHKAVSIDRHFTKEGEQVFDTVEWELRDAVIRDPSGAVIFEQKGVEFPKTWSQLATNVVTEKYFRGKLGTPERETSLKQVIERVVNTIGKWGVTQKYFRNGSEDAVAFVKELAYIVLHQRAVFNSPVWFNLGVADASPQVSACFIQSVDDSMDSIMELAKSEVMLFKGGSGTGTNLSALRGSNEYLSGGGRSSGPLSFMKGYDSFAGVIKSGGKTRRAAKMVMLDVDHPDILKFIECKAEEERKAHALIEAGWDGGWNAAGGAYDSVQYQNANHSVRVSDEFMQAAEDDKSWPTHNRLDGSPAEFHSAKEILRAIAENAHFCGDPGVQYDTTINAWHTCSNDGRINASNPCSEYMHLDDTACNLASINLRKFEQSPNGIGWFDVEGFQHTVKVMITAQDIMVAPAHYPTNAIGAGARKYRQLGLGYANLGGLLMSRGMPYDSWEGRRTAAYITDLMQASAYQASSELAQVVGAFDGYEANAEPMLAVIDKHMDADRTLSEFETRSTMQNHKTWSDLADAAGESWSYCRDNGGMTGYRNSQVSVLAPTGTIAFMMDCDTTGIEPEISLVKFKSLAGGGSLKLVNRVVEDALNNLGYSEDEATAVRAYISEHGRVEGCPVVRQNDISVFDCSFRAPGGTRVLAPHAHLRMMAAVQPFLSGAISKTVNVDTDTTVEEIESLYLEAWKLKLKAVAIYRDGCKKTQPLSTSEDQTKEDPKTDVVLQRRRMNDERDAKCHKFTIGGHEGYLHVGLYEDGTVGELFIRMAKEGSTISGMMDAFATSISIGLQYGVPLATFVEKFKHTRFEPSGFTQRQDIRMAQSIIDYIFRYLELTFIEAPAPAEAEVNEVSTGTVSLESAEKNSAGVFVNQTDAPMCSTCGNITVRNGSCHKCLVCGTSNGCS